MALKAFPQYILTLVLPDLRVGQGQHVVSVFFWAFLTTAPCHVGSQVMRTASSIVTDVTHEVPCMILHVLV